MTVALAKKRIRSWDIAEYLRKEIRRNNLAPNTPIMSTRNLANHFQASLVTANRALNTLVDENVLYRVQGSGSFVKGKNRPQRRLIIGLMESVADQERNGFYAAHGIFIDSCLDELREKKCDVRYFSYQNLAEQKFPKESFDGLDGLIVSNSCIDKNTLPLLEKFSGSITLYANEYQLKLPFNQVLPDLDRGFRALFRQLDKSKVDGIITMSARHANADAREKHFIEAALNAGFKRKNIEEIEVKLDEGDNGRISGYNSAKELLTEFPNKLLFITSDFIAFGVIDAMKEAGIEPGRDLQLVSYDNLEGSNMRPFGEPILTSIDHPKSAISKRAVDMTIDAIRNNDSCQHIVRIPTHLEIRKTGLG
jgi:DNA-binding LacI/PurR family transcriptional regulator